MKIGGFFGVWLDRVLRRSGGGSSRHADWVDEGWEVEFRRVVGEQVG